MLCASGEQPWSLKELPFSQSSLTYLNSELKGDGNATRYSNAFPILVTTNAMPLKVCYVGEHQYDNWSRSGIDECAIFVLYEHDALWDLYLIGYVSKYKNNVFKSANLMSANLAAYVVGPVSEAQYLFHQDLLDKRIENVHPSAQKDLLYVAASQQAFTRTFNEEFKKLMSMSIGTTEAITKRLKLYSAILENQSQSVEMMRNTMDVYLETLQLGDLEIQRYCLLLLLVFATDNEDFGKVLFECERLIGRIMSDESHINILRETFKKMCDNQNKINKAMWATLEWVSSYVKTNIGDCKVIIETGINNNN